MNVGIQTYLPLDFGRESVQQAANASKTKSLEEAKAVAQDFEAFFLSKMTELMFEGISTEGVFGGGHAEKIYRSMLINEYGKVMAQTGTVGVSDAVMSSILAMQEAEAAGQEG